MSFAGTVLDMISRSNHNRSQIVARHEKVKKLNELYSNSPHYKGVPFHEKKLSIEQSEKIKSDIRREIKSANIKYTVVTFLTLISLFPLIIIIIYFISNTK